MKYAIAALLLTAMPAMAQDKPVLTVYAGDYIASEWGPGPKMKKGSRRFAIAICNS